MDASKIIGRAPERLTIDERLALAGKWAAFEIYSPQTLPLRRIEAIGDSVDDCIRQLTQRGLDASHFEFTPIEPAF